MLLAALGGLAGCRSLAPLPPVNLGEPGWNVRQGQAVWRTGKKAPELAGEVMVASHEDGRALVQFTKTPLPFVVAQTTTNSWQVDFIPNNRRYSGLGFPPTRLIWLHLLPCLSGARPLKPLVFQRTGDHEWKLENRATGEMISGYLTP